MKTYTMAVLIVLVSVSCRRDDLADQRTDRVTPETVERARADWPESVALQIDSGNAAYSARDFDAALRHYGRAAELRPDIPAAWWGIYIAESGRGNVAAADSAMVRARALASGASLIHPAPDDTTTMR